ncbi:MAG: hypothetical protein D6758_00800 [Gammaproteobacteria bacterium]|nr:MAG: hypothetical protein D6758_00800 [Gammaproteobacteria bacterium]
MSFIFHALLTGVLLAALTGPLGCFVVWRRMAYFGDTLAHAGLLGIALGLMFEIAPFAAIIVVSTAVGLLLSALERQRMLATDTLLGLLAHGTLAAGLVAISLSPQPGVSLEAFLLGDILASGQRDAALAALIAFTALSILARYRRELILVTLSPDLAQVEGVPVRRVQQIFTVLLATVIASAVKVVGVLLVTALLIIPAAAVRPISRTPEKMALNASLLGMLSVCGGLACAWYLDWPAGPAIVLSAVAGFGLLRILPAQQ